MGEPGDLEPAMTEVSAAQHPPKSEWFWAECNAADKAELAQAALAGLLVTEDPFALIERAEATHRAHWSMLDGLEAGTCV